MKLEPVIGLEVHVHLNTKSKLFCSCANVSEAEKPNQYVCPVCMGFPGTLPVLNGRAVEWAILAGLALGCRVAEHCSFARKSYFYPDLPKGYQISQYDEPLCVDGRVRLSLQQPERFVRIHRVHLEEDAAKNIHTTEATLVDHNRAGTPLIEIVTQPDLRSPAEAKVFLEQLQHIMWYLNISNADMEHGDLRVDANISLRQQAVGSRQQETTKAGELSPKTEVKNLNSFRAVERALAYEIERQTALWGTGTPPTQETRGWSEKSQETVSQRVKEGEADYRYFPEPDIPPLHIEPALVEKLRAALPELPVDKEERFRRQYQMSVADAHLLVEEKALADYAEEVFSEISMWENDRTDVSPRDIPKLHRLAVNYLLRDFRNTLLHRGLAVGKARISPENFAELVIMLFRAEINRNAVPGLLQVMEETGGDPSTIVRERNLGQVSDDDALRRLVQDVITQFPVEVDKIRSGKTAVLEFLVGQVMATTKGRAHPDKVRTLFREELGLSSADTAAS